MRAENLLTSGASAVVETIKASAERRNAEESGGAILLSMSLLRARCACCQCARMSDAVRRIGRQERQPAVERRIAPGTSGDRIAADGAHAKRAVDRNALGRIASAVRGALAERATN